VQILSPYLYRAIRRHHYRYYARPAVRRRLLAVFHRKQVVAAFYIATHILHYPHDPVCTYRVATTRITRVRLIVRKWVVVNYLRVLAGDIIKRAVIVRIDLILKYQILVWRTVRH